MERLVNAGSCYPMTVSDPQGLFYEAAGEILKLRTELAQVKKERDELAIGPKIVSVSEVSEDDGEVIFVRFGRENDSSILGEPPEITLNSINTYGFKCDEWEYFFKINWNSIFEQAESKEALAQTKDKA